MVTFENMRKTAKVKIGARQVVFEMFLFIQVSHYILFSTLNLHPKYLKSLANFIGQKDV